MSGALRKMGVYLGLVEDGERYNARYDDDYDEGYDEYEDEAVDGESDEAEPVPGRRDEQVGTVSKFPDRRGVAASSRRLPSWPASPPCTRAATTRRA